MFESDNHFSSVIKQIFSGRIVKDCKESFYVPKIELPSDTRQDMFVFDPNREGYTKEYVIKDFVV